MRYPVNYIAIAQGYHQGKCLDFGWSILHGGKNQPVYAVTDAVVYSIENQPNGGNVIYLKHSDNKCSCYAHLDKILVKKGDKVNLGQQIGTVGATGNVAGNNLHFGLFTNVNVRYKNSTLDPFEYLEVYEGQIVGATTSKNYPIKYYVENNIKEYYVTAKSLNVRSNTNLLGKAINTLPQGTKINYVEKVGSFVKIGENQYVWESYLTQKRPQKIYKTKVVTEEQGLNVRNTNSTAGKIVNTLEKGTIVAVMEEKNGWTKIDENKWVSSNYLK